jgi:hypothetical protein
MQTIITLGSFRVTSQVAATLHPPVRIKCVIEVAAMWCGQNRSAPAHWFAPARFQALFRAAAELATRADRQSWDAHMAFLHSEQGTTYDRALFDRFDALRRKRD